MKVSARFDRISLTASAVLIGLALVEASWPHALDVGRAASVDGEEARAPVEASAAPYPERSVLDGMAERPLFTVDRRRYVPPPSAASAATAGPLPPSLDADLLGIAKAADSELILVRLRSSSTVHRLRVGGQIEGWTVTSIGASTATLSSNGSDLDLTLVASAAH